MPGSPHVRRATADDRSAMLDALAAAFAEDLVLTHLIPADATRRATRLRAFFTMELRRSLHHGGAWTSTDGAGAALWFPPGAAAPTLGETLQQVPAAVRAFGRRLPVAVRTQARMSGRHPRAPHWYLYFVGARPDRQGSGVGTALLRAVLDTCDVERLPAYLEATSLRNRALYARHGFVGTDEYALPDDGPVLHPMWREPA